MWQDKTQADICARANFKTYAGLLADMPEAFGISSQEKASRAVLGPALDSFWVDYTRFDPEVSIQKQAQQAGFYYYSVEIDGKSVADMPVCLEDGQWKPIDIGGGINRVVEQTALENYLNTLNK